MKFINRRRIETDIQALNWDEIKQSHMDAMQNMSPAERKEYIKKHPDWNVLQPIMLKLSHNKCWYTEAPIGSSDFEIDHFRPKSRSKQKVDYKDPSSKSVILKEDGYWWLAYDWKNYRLSGALVNKLRRDRLGDCNDVQGKGDYFPLDLTDIGKVADDLENTACEIPILLDPCNAADVCLLAFDSNGEAISGGQNEKQHEKVFQSIFYYHLNLDQLVKERLQVWKDCEREIKEIKRIIDEAPDERAKHFALSSCYERLIEYVSDPDRPYSSVIKSCIKVYAELDEYCWLRNFRDSVLVGLTE